MENVVVAAFPALSDARQGLGELRRLEGAGAVKIRGAALIERHGDGRWTVHSEQEEKLEHDGMVGGGTLGALVGLLGGPLGMILGAAAGATVGAAADVGEAQEGAVLERVFPHLVPTGTSAVVADVEEERTTDFDGAMTALGGAVHRMGRDELVSMVETQRG